MAYEFIHIPGTRILLHIDTQTEITRARLFTPLLKKYGKGFPHRPFAGEYRTMDPKGRCFDQAMELAKETGLAYVEGFLVFHTQVGMVGIGHGWCVDHNNLVVDPTSWMYTGNPIVDYVGIPIKVEYSDKWKELTGYYGCMDGLYDGKNVYTDVGIYKDPPEEWLRKLWLRR
jgi:hypothetical protein